MKAQSHTPSQSATHAAHRLDVFLGGSCNPTTWRHDIAIPMLDRAGVTYYNPQADNWSPELVDVETRAKDHADQLLFVIDSDTRAIASILEATEAICTDRAVSLVVKNVDPVRRPEFESEAKDLNRARAYLRDLATRHNVRVYPSVTAAVAGIIATVQESAR
jgi:raw